jgi:hypothetical protein
MYVTQRRRNGIAEYVGNDSKESSRAVYIISLYYVGKFKCNLVCSHIADVILL